MPSPPLDITNGRTTSGVACNHHLWAAQTVKQHRAWHALIALGQYRRSDGVGRRMPSSPLDSTHGRPSSGVPCHHSPWIAHTVGRRRAWHAIIAFGQHRRSAVVGRGRAWHAIIALGQHKGSAIVGRACTERSVVACPHRSWLA